VAIQPNLKLFSQLCDSWRIFPTAPIIFRNVQIEGSLNIITSNRNTDFSSFCEQNVDESVTSQSERVDEIVVTNVVIGVLSKTRIINLLGKGASTAGKSRCCTHVMKLMPFMFLW
jgi:hypothetical protein